MITVLDASYTRLANLKKVITAKKTEAINGEYTLDFEVMLEDKWLTYITADSVFEVDNDYFDMGLFQLIAEADGKKLVKIEADHVSYRLNDSDYNLDYATYTGTGTEVLTQILSGTGFTVGTVFDNSEVTYSAQEPKSRRQVLMEFVATLEGELSFNKFEISIVAQRGSSDPKPVLKGRNVKVVSKKINKRNLDDEGKPAISYECTPTYLPSDTYSLGDNIVLMQRDFAIAEALRFVKFSYNPYDRSDVTMVFANYTNGLEDSIYRIETESVIKDNIYNGCRIGPTYGFEVVRSDNLSRAFFRSDGLKIQKGDGTGVNWDDVFYVDGEGNLIMTGSIYILNTDGTGTIVDSYGIDPIYLDYFKNMVYNSSFELLDDSGDPLYWEGTGTATQDSNFKGSSSLALDPSEYMIQTTSAIINPEWYEEEQTRVSFHRKLGSVKIEVYDVTNDSYFTLTDEDGNTGLSITTPATTNWQDSRYSVSFVPNESGHETCVAYKLKFTNEHISETSYIDCVMVAPDFTGKWPQLYKDGPKSLNITEISNGTEILVQTATPPAPDDPLTTLWFDIN